MIGIILLSIIIAAIYLWVKNGGAQRFHIRLEKFFDPNILYLGVVVLVFSFVMPVFFSGLESDSDFIKDLGSIVEVFINCLSFFGVLIIIISFFMRKKF